MTDLSDKKVNSIDFEGPTPWHGYWLRVMDGDNELILYVSLITGNEKIYFNRKLVAKTNHFFKRALFMRSIWLRADVGEDQYIIDLMTSNVMRYKLDYLVRKNGKVLQQGSKTMLEKYLSWDGVRKVTTIFALSLSLGIVLGSLNHSSFIHTSLIEAGQFLKSLAAG